MTSGGSNYNYFSESLISVFNKKKWDGGSGLPVPVVYATAWTPKKK